MQDNILEKGYWQDISTDLQKPPASPEPARSMKWWAELVRPEFLAKTGTRAQSVRRTAYLDGLRGFAALMVYLGHHQLWAHDDEAGQVFENAYGFENKHYFAALPGIRTFFSGGHFAVSVFFVLSGYVLSTKPLSLINSGEYLKLGDNISSALFRRWLRLFIPVIATTFLYMTSWHLFGIHAVPDPKGSYRDELWNWYCEMKNFSFIFRTGGEPWFEYNFHTWSIPVEFQGSIVVYTSLLALGRCTRNARLLCETGLFVYFMYIVDGSFCAMFVAGMLLCDLDILAENDNLPDFFSRFKPHRDPIFYALFLVSLYLGGAPSRSNDIMQLRESPGWYYLSFFTPQAVFNYKSFYLFWAAAFLVASISRISFLKAFFETRANQYLGRISFCFYLIHGPVLWILGDRLYAATGWVNDTRLQNIPAWVNRFPITKAGPLGLEVSFLLPQLILLPVTLWLAEVGTKLLDEPSVKFVHWFRQRTLPPSAKSM